MINLQSILKEIMSLSRPPDMPKKITELEHLLLLIQRQSNPELWAAIQVDLGASLAQNPQGNRAENLEKAIKHYNQAFEVYTRKHFPKHWATTQNYLGIAYFNRILGDRAKNLEEAINHYNQALEVRTYRDFRVEWAMIQNNLGNAYSNLILGDRAENIENAIEHYNQALEVRTRNDFPVDWAMTQNNLANAYSERIKGDIAENIENAINCYNQALEVRTQKNFRVEWAMTQHNLGNAYRIRILGDRAKNIEQAIEHYTQALEVRTRNHFPVDWAMTQNNLGLAYDNRIKGDKADNLEQAIEHYNQALEVRTRNHFPVDWAGTQNNLANAYSERIRGDIAENIEKAIEHFNKALEVRTHKDFPVDWAMTQNNLANAYCDRILGDRARNLEQAIEHYNQALEVRTRNDFPADWATTQNNLGNAYSNLILGDRAENIEKGIEHYNQALEVRTRNDFPVDWATTQNNLATTYSIRILGDRADNIEKAIEYYNQALEVRTREGFPVDWAMTQNNLATAYSNRILGDRVRNIEQTISYCHSALEIYKLESTPDSYRRTYRFLGDLYFNMEQWEDTFESYKNAIKAGDLLYRSGLSAESKILEAKENADIYQNASFAACNLGLAKESLLTLEKGKVRLLSEALRLKMKKPEGTPKDQWIKYEQAAEKYRTAIAISDNKEDYAQREKDVQIVLEELNSAIQIIQRYNPEFQKELDISDILSIVDSETALLTFCITEKGSIGFVVSKLNGIKSVDIPNFKTEDLNILLFKPNGQKLDGWIGDYLNYRNTLGTDHNWNFFQVWQKSVNNTLSNIGVKLLYPLLAELPLQTKKLIILPSGGLFLLPLHAVPLFDGQLFCQRYCISYAPSIQLLKEMQTKAGKIEGKELYAVVNPQEDPTLLYSGCEGKAISKLFESHQVNMGKTGTKATVFKGVPGWAYLHFSCHGNYNWNDPAQSGLYLFGGHTLSLADLQSDVVDMSSTRLVTLSACETGITDIIKGSANEFISLSAGFMLAGVPCVVSSLWSVPDISTALLMERFYSNHIVGGMDIPKALQDAQLWVRDLTASEVADYVEKCYRSGEWEGKSRELLKQSRRHYFKMAEQSPDDKPFQHPHYWAAFTVNGA